MKALRGFSIGGQASAGGSTFYAGMREFTYLSRLPQHISHEINNRTLLVRWLDDLLHVYPTNLSAGAMRALRRMQRLRFYGGTLELLESSPTVAFGFWVQTRHNRLLVREKFTYTTPAQQNAAPVDSAWPLIPPAWQFGVHTTNYTTALGRYIRHLDTTNGVEEDVLNGLKRISSELIEAGYDRKMLTKAVKQVSFHSHLDLRSLIQFHELPTNSHQSWAKTYDAFVGTLWVQKAAYLEVHNLLDALIQNQ